MRSPRPADTGAPGPAGGPGPVVFVAWGAVQGRSAEIAAALGGEAYCLYPPVDRHRPPAPVRYAAGAVLTARYLLRRRPRAIIVTNPPIFPALLAWLYVLSRRAGEVCLALDSHPGSFGRQGDRLGARMVPVHAFLAARADVCLVTTEEWVAVVQRWGGRAAVVHEAPGGWVACGPRALRERPQVLFVSRFAPDEPVPAVLEAARLLPEADFVVTGRRSGLAPGVGESAPPNVRFAGFLDSDAYRRAVYEADVVLALTTEPTSVMRAAYEAVYAAKPLAVSDWELARDLFPSAVHVANEGPAIAAGLADALRRYPDMAAAAASARATQLQRWEAQLEELRARLCLVAGP